MAIYNGTNGPDLSHTGTSPPPLRDPAFAVPGSIDATNNDTLNGFAGIDVLQGYRGVDTLNGGDGDDTLWGDTRYEPAMNSNDVGDVLNGEGGNDTLKGGPGNDFLDGGVGAGDTAVFSGHRADYVVTLLGNGDVQVFDQRVGSPEGTDTIRNTENFRFENGTLPVAPGWWSVLGDDAIFTLAQLNPTTDDYASNTRSTTGQVSAGGSIIGNLETNGDHDWFSTSLAAGHNYIVYLVGAYGGLGTLPDPLVRLHRVQNDVDTVLTSDDDGGLGLSSRLALHVNNPGTYYVDAGAYNDGSTGSYTLDIEDLGTSTTLFHQARFGTANFSPANGGWTSDNQYPRELGDVNGDGAADIVGFGAAGIYVALSTGVGTFSNPAFALAQFGAAPSAGGWASDDQYPRELGDVNGDGLDDIVGFGVAGTYVSLATGGGHFAPMTFELAQFGAAGSAGGWASANASPRELADVNNDGRADIVGFGSGGVYVSLAAVGGHFAAPTFALAQFGAAPSAGGWASDDLYSRELGDVNGDGSDDIVGFGAAGTYVSLATGAGTFSNPTLVLAQFGAAPSGGGWASDDLYPRELGDVNGDGRDDIVGFGHAGVYLAYGRSDGTFDPVFFDHPDFGIGAGGYINADLYPRHVGDITGDGRDDIVGFGINVYTSQAIDDFFVV